MDKFLYLDNAATTKTAPEVLKLMLRILQRSSGTHPAFIHLQREIKKWLMFKGTGSLRR